MPVDKKDFSFTKTFGQIKPQDLPKEFILSNPLGIKNQYQSDFCGAFALTGVRELQEGKTLSQMRQMHADIKEKLLAEVEKSPSKEIEH